MVITRNFADMKFRMLTDTELECFEQEFKQFLIVNGVEAKEWEKMNVSNKEKAIQLVELFSDTVLQKVYGKIKYLEHRNISSCLVFKFNKDNIELISINVKIGAKIDLSTPESIHEALINSAHLLTVFKTQKEYSGNKEDEIHLMLETGCVNSTASFWNMLEKVL